MKLTFALFCAILGTALVTVAMQLASTGPDLILFPLGGILLCWGVYQVADHDLKWTRLIDAEERLKMRPYNGPETRL